jgi:hypothetical protein
MLEAVWDVDSGGSLYTRLLRVKSSVLRRSTGAECAYGISRYVYHFFRGEYRPWLRDENNVIMQARLEMVNE